MNRRHFCKIASLALGAIGLDSLPASATVSQRLLADCDNSRQIATDCRVTVLRREYHPDLQSLYLDDPDSGPCRMLHSGDEFVFSAGMIRPTDFCPRLWDIICIAVATDSDCNLRKNDGTIVISCPDGTRPVIVRVDKI